MSFTFRPDGHKLHTFAGNEVESFVYVCNLVEPAVEVLLNLNPLDTMCVILKFLSPLSSQFTISAIDHHISTKSFSRFLKILPHFPPVRLGQCFSRNDF